jgi:hypothetical protein
MTTNNQHITELCNQLVAAVRADVKQDLYQRFKAEFDFQTGMHGEPINQAQPKTRGQRGKDKRPFRPNSPLARIYRTLASRKIHRLRGQGYEIVSVRRGYRLPKYRLAS